MSFDRPSDTTGGLLQLDGPRIGDIKRYSLPTNVPHSFLKKKKDVNKHICCLIYTSKPLNIIPFLSLLSISKEKYESSI